MNRIKQWMKSQAVLCLSLLAAVVSAFFVPPSAAYLGYIDWRVLSLLFCLMLVVAGFQQAGVLEILAQRLVKKASTTKSLCLILVLIPFFTSMLITNDVALITFVPLAIATLGLTGQYKQLIFVVCMQTVAANLGSMLTPFGNPQNLYLFSYYQLGAGDFFGITLPLTAIGFLLVLGFSLIPGGSGNIQVSFAQEASLRSGKDIVFLCILGALCLMSVVRIVPYPFTLLCVVLWALSMQRKLLLRVDYGLLLTFICFFIFVGNLGNIPEVRQFIGDVIAGRELLASVLISQVISNVPAAVMLSSFTEDYTALIEGTNVGGLGTLVASLASLISFKFYLATPNARPLRYLAVFTGINLIMLFVLYQFAAIL